MPALMLARVARRRFACLAVLTLSMGATATALGGGGTTRDECPYLYGIHDHDPYPAEFLNHVSAAGRRCYVTATVAIGHNPADTGGVNFTAFENAGHTVICRLNNGYCSTGTIPLPEHYAAFAQRCANFVAASPGCHIWLIGNETNLATEWPPRNGHKEYVSPQDYAACFRLCYDAIKAVRPQDKVISQALAPFGGPYGGGTVCGFSHDGVPINWTQYLHQMLTAIEQTGGIDGIALHINSRGYDYEDIHSTQQVVANGEWRYFSFYVYKDWVDHGIPSSLYHLPLYATEVNGIYYWKGGFPEDPAAHYEPGWMQEIHAEIDRYNQFAVATGRPVYRCLNMYRWCSWCDDWNIDGADNPYKAQILADWDAAMAAGYTWPTQPTPPDADFAAVPTGGPAPLTVQFEDRSTQGTPTEWLWTFGDGNSSDQQNPQHVYESPGTYTVSLTAENAVGSDTTTRPDYITVTVPPGPGDSLLVNGSFADGVAHWTSWIERDQAGDFVAEATSGFLHCRGSNYNGGAFQQFHTGGAGTRLVIDGMWTSTPTLPESQWGEVIVINGGRLPTNGADETGTSSPENVLCYKNDTWATPGGWSGPMPDTSPLALDGAFRAEGDLACVLLKSGNAGGGLTGVAVSHVDVRVADAAGLFDADDVVGSADFAGLLGCFSAPGGWPAPNAPTTITNCLGAFDFDADDDVDLRDVAAFHVRFQR